MAYSLQIFRRAGLLQSGPVPTVLLFPLPHWMSPSLGLDSIRLFAWLNAKLHLRNDLTVEKKSLKKAITRPLADGDVAVLGAGLLLPGRFGRRAFSSGAGGAASLPAVTQTIPAALRPAPLPGSSSPAALRLSSTAAFSPEGKPL